MLAKPPERTEVSCGGGWSSSPTVVGLVGVALRAIRKPTTKPTTNRVTLTPRRWSPLLMMAARVGLEGFLLTSEHKRKGRGELRVSGLKQTHPNPQTHPPR